MGNPDAKGVEGVVEGRGHISCVFCAELRPAVQPDRFLCLSAHSEGIAT